MMLFQSLAGVVLVLVAFILRSMNFQKRMFPPPNIEPKDIVQIIPEDPIIHERVARLPVKKQKKCRRISCKSRSAVTFKPKFKNGRSAPPKLVYLVCNFSNSTVIFFSETHHGVASPLFQAHIPKGNVSFFCAPLHCNGLFVLPIANNVLVCNPATKQAMTLPQSSNEHVPRISEKENEGRNMRVGFGFLQSTQAFKVAQFFYRSCDLKKKRYSMGFEVFTIGVSTSWRVLPKDPPYPIWNSCWSYNGKCIYFYIWHRFRRSAPNAFLCFSLRNEKFSVLHPPISLKRFSVADMMLTNLQGCVYLSYLSLDNTKFCVFTAKQGGNSHEWTPKFCFSVVVEPDGALILPIAEYQGNLFTRVTGLKSQSFKCYNSKDGSFEEVNDQLEDSKMKREGFTFFRNKPWFCISSYQENLFKL